MSATANVVDLQHARGRRKPAARQVSVLHPAGRLDVRGMLKQLEREISSASWLLFHESANPTAAQMKQIDGYLAKNEQTLKFIVEYLEHERI